MVLFYKSTFLVFLFWISGSNDAPLPNEKMIWSPSNKVTLSCFKGVPDASSFARSHSNSGVEMTYSCRSNFFQPRISAYFDCTHAWIKDEKDPNLIALEQLKFDIAHFHAIKLQKQVAGLIKPCSIKSKEFELMASEINHECHEMQLQAEQMSEFGKEMSVLEMWSLKIKIEIETMVAQNRNRGFANK